MCIMYFLLLTPTEKSSSDLAAVFILILSEILYDTKTFTEPAIVLKFAFRWNSRLKLHCGMWSRTGIHQNTLCMKRSCILQNPLTRADPLIQYSTVDCESKCKNLKGQCHEIFDNFFLLKRFDLGPIWTGKNCFANFFFFSKIFLKNVCLHSQLLCRNGVSIVNDYADIVAL